MFRLATLALAVALTACEPPTDPLDKPHRRLVIHAVLDAGHPVQWIAVQYLDGEFGHRLTGVAGCEVTITAPDGSVFRATQGYNDEFGVMYGVSGLGLPKDSLAFVPGETYTLRVRTPAGEEASGTTTMPQFSAPSAGLTPLRESIPTLTRARDTVRLDWPRLPLASRYEVSVEAVRGPSGSTQFFERTYSAFTDTSITILGTARTLENDEVFVPGTTAIVQATAVDDNYYTYYHLNVDPFAGAPPSRLTGAVGVFGSIVPIRQRTYDEVR